MNQPSVAVRDSEKLLLYGQHKYYKRYEKAFKSDEVKKPEPNVSHLELFGQSDKGETLPEYQLTKENPLAPFPFQRSPINLSQSLVLGRVNPAQKQISFKKFE